MPAFGICCNIATLRAPTLGEKISGTKNVCSLVLDTDHGSMHCFVSPLSSNKHGELNYNNVDYDYSFAAVDMQLIILFILFFYFSSHRPTAGCKHIKLVIDE